MVMAIINLTTDSFYDGGKYDSPENVLRDAEQKINEGASLIDLGAASSRQGATEIPAEEEWKRLSAVLPQLRKTFPNVFISIDTYRASIAERAASEGADMINDISAGNADPRMFITIAKLDLPYVMMHMQGNPRTMQANPHYGNVVDEVRDELLEKAKRLESMGFNKLLLDPGFGFGKTTEHNYALLKHLDVLTRLPYPCLAGLSRKSMINKVIGTSAVTALNGTTVLNTIALLNGASILRVHDVTEAKQCIELVEKYTLSS